MTAGKDLENTRCVPFVSEYSDCTEENLCTGCTRCTCTAMGQWSCKRTSECTKSDFASLDENTLDNAYNVLNFELKNRGKAKPQPVNRRPKPKEDREVVLDKDDDIEKRIMELMSRKKRAIDNHNSLEDVHETKNNGTIKFYHTVDELNEDTLKHNNGTGTITAKKIDINIPKISRRTSMLLDGNISVNPLHIEKSRPPKFDHDNTIDVTTHTEDIEKRLSYKYKITTNYTQNDKNKELSKIVVKELKKGTEIIGSKNAPIMSNITFTPENDTLTAMAFIAGNLLNKLWSMEKDSDETLETDDMKYQKITDLLELFKEPLTLRQEQFLKSALQRISEAMDKNKDPKNMSICETIEINPKNLRDDDSSDEKQETSTSKVNVPKTEPKLNATVNALSKLNNVLTLIKKFQSVNKNLSAIKSPQKKGDQEDSPQFRTYEPSKPVNISDPESSSISLFGGVLEKLTRLLLPNKASRRLSNKIKNQNLFGSTKELKRKLKDRHDVDLTNMTLSVKDKLLLDYLTRVSDEPRLLNVDADIGNAKPQSIKADILLNIAQFYKIKSFVDLLKLLGVDQMSRNIPILRTKVIQATINPFIFKSTTTTTTTTTTDTPVVYTKPVEILEKKSIDDKRRMELHGTKTRLKLHLKSILDDLIELQKERGVSVKEGQIKIADALPCIYSILNAAETPAENGATPQSSALQKVQDAFETMKKELTTNIATRRMDNGLNARPKSAVVLERVVKSLEKKDKQNSRRNMGGNRPKTYEEVKFLIDQIDASGSRGYKKYVVFADVPLHERQMLLKAMLADLKQYTTVLDVIKSSFDLVKDHTDIQVFVNVAIDNINVIKKLIKSAEKRPQDNKPIVRKIAVNLSVTPKPYKKIIDRKQIIRMSEVADFDDNGNDANPKLNRDQILIQLIKNRITLFMKLKEAKGFDLEDDPSYNIAKNIMKNLEIGNIRLAKELYKIFVTTKTLDLDINKGVGNAFASVMKPAPKAPVMQVSPRRQFSIFDKEPLIKFEDPSPRRMDTIVRDQMVKQLLNIQNMRS